jgi:hypothetical protein
VRAAAAAARDDGDHDALGYVLVSQRRLVRAIAAEYRRQGHPVSKDEFGEQFYAWAIEDPAVAALVVE